MKWLENHLSGIQRIIKSYIWQKQRQMKLRHFFKLKKRRNLNMLGIIENMNNHGEKEWIILIL